jgi:nitrite reductase/ring-hydroxylating ferredoxin subunit
MSTRVAAGTLSSLQPGEARVVPLPRGSFGAPAVIPLEALVVLDQAGVARAYLNRCRHLPVPLAVLWPPATTSYETRDPLSWDGQALECRTHGALYRLDDGMCFEGPCEGRALLPIELVLEGDALYLIATF